MNKKNKNKPLDPVEDPEVLTSPVTEEEKAEALCPTCGVPVTTHKCRFCGATRSVNAVSGNVIWMRNGRVIAAFKDAKIAYIDMAVRYGIPKEDWPEKFR